VKRRALIALFCVVTVAVGVENFLFFSSSGRNLTWSHPDLDEALESETTSAEPEPLSPIVRPQLVAWLKQRAGAARNPFLTRAEEDQLGESRARTLPHLSATLWSAGRRVAWIDGAPRSEGDFVREHEVESIEPRGAVLRDGDTRVHLEMGPLSVPPLQREAREGLDDAE
jgi:hypothetical protein